MLHTSQRIRQITDDVLRRAGITRPRVAMTLRNFETTQLLAAKGMAWPSFRWNIRAFPLQISSLRSSASTKNIMHTGIPALPP